MALPAVSPSGTDTGMQSTSSGNAQTNDRRQGQRQPRQQRAPRPQQHPAATEPQLVSLAAHHDVALDQQRAQQVHDHRQHQENNGARGRGRRPPRPEASAAHAYYPPDYTGAEGQHQHDQQQQQQPRSYEQQQPQHVNERGANVNLGGRGWGRGRPATHAYPEAPADADRQRPPRGRGTGRGRGRGRGGMAQAHGDETAPQHRPQHAQRPSSQHTQQRAEQGEPGARPRRAHTAAEILARQGWRNVQIEQYSDRVQEIVELLRANEYECMVCTEVIKRAAPTWSCECCYAVFHLTCVRKWARASNEENAWRCPGCQFVNLAQPREYRCFCGKLAEPPSNPYLAPHSCGELCGRLRAGTECPHPCSALCHPGPCTPCAALGKAKSCHCGRTTYRLKCSDVDVGRSCGAVCDGALACGRHRCPAVCHAAPCGQCTATVPAACYCGRQRSEQRCAEMEPGRPAGSPMFSCGAVCGRTLDCGNHACTRSCHAGPCDGCALLPARLAACPCGRTPLAALLPAPRASCLDPVPTCGRPCGAARECGHPCSSPCHAGPCPGCGAEVAAGCRCGATGRAVRCGEGVPLCEEPCGAKKSCGRHRCSAKCCPAQREGGDRDGLHICQLPCGKKLKCGVHTCDLLCHSGHCPPCGIVSREPVSCPCGRVSLRPPVRCGAQLPDCPEPCRKPRDCGHACPRTCHEGACPPCVVFVEKACSGGHGQRRRVACNLTAVSCGAPCAQPLCCGEHTCPRPCHPAPCVAGASSNKLTLTSCHLPCGALRPCGHKCKATCHPCEACPEEPCGEPVRAECACGRLARDATCATREALPCDDECHKLKEVEERNRALADALGVTPKPPGFEEHGFGPELIAAGRARPGLVEALERRLHALLSERPACPAQTARCVLGPLGPEERAALHELARAYGVASSSRGSEPSRVVTLVADPAARLPRLLLSEVLQHLPPPEAAPLPVRRPPKPRRREADAWEDDDVTDVYELPSAAAAAAAARGPTKPLEQSRTIWAALGDDA